MAPSVAQWTEHPRQSRCSCGCRPGRARAHHSDTRLTGIPHDAQSPWRHHAVALVRPLRGLAVLLLTGAYCSGLAAAGAIAGVPPVIRHTDAASDPARPTREAEPRTQVEPSGEPGRAWVSAFGRCGAPATPISAVQGTGRTSPLQGRSVVVEATVVGDFEGEAALRGFSLQAQAGDQDPDSSEGLFVFNRGRDRVDVGDRVRVQGRAEEYYGLTELTDIGRLRVCGRDRPLPPPARLRMPAPGTVQNADGQRIADLEPYEGMRVTLSQALTVTALEDLDRFGEVTLAGGGRLFQFTNSHNPEPQAHASHQASMASRRLTLDDGSARQNPEPIPYLEPAAERPLRIGDTVTDLTGVLYYSRGSSSHGRATYRLMPTAPPQFERTGRRPGPPSPRVGLRVASVNLQNLFNGDGSGGFPTPRGADSPKELRRQMAKLVTALSAVDADIYALMELENDYPDGSASAVAGLVDALNRSGRTACDRYDYVSPPGSQRLGDDAIAVGLIYCSDTVALTSDSHVAVLDDAALSGLGLQGPIFDGPDSNRAALAVSVRARQGGDRFTVVVAHLKSKQPGDLDCPGDPNCAQGDGQGSWAPRRLAGAKALARWLGRDPTGSGDPHAMLIGDLNAYLEEDPIRFLEDRGMVNLATRLRSNPRPYSYVYDGKAGLLGYAFATPRLARQVESLHIWHSNADEADALDYNLDFGRNPALFEPHNPYRASDHDLVIVDLKPAAGTAEGNARP